MPAVITTNAVIMCSHGGRVELVPGQVQVSVQGGYVVCEPDLVGAPIVGCTLPPTSATSPCTNVIETLPGSSSTTILVGGRPAYLDTLVGVTNSRPPGEITVVFAGQESVQGA